MEAHMMMSCRSRFFWFALALLAGVVPGMGADYPTKPIQIITQAAAGSGPDVIGRIVADQLGRRLGQQVLIINRPGAGGLIAAQGAVAAEPDGYSLYMPSSSALMVLPETHSKLSFSFDRDFVPIGMIGQTPMLIAVSPNLGALSLAELITLAKSRPGELFFAGNTPGTVPTLTGEMLKQRANIDITFVPYPGSAAALKDIFGGRISIVIESPAALEGAVQGGKLKALAIASEKRISQMPDVPTVAETLPGFRATGWFALMARAGTPDEIVQKISKSLNEALADKELREKFAKLGTEATPMSSEQLHAFVEAEKKTWLPVIRHTVAKVE
jgi:tripartite-type tricarboxylate transporter receptor subunit TctC